MVGDAAGLAGACLGLEPVHQVGRVVEPLAGCPVGLTVAPVIAAPGWAEAYGEPVADAATALAGVPRLDLTVERITHRFTAGSKAVLEGWYPGSALDMGDAGRSTERTKFGTEKQVYDAATMHAA